MWHDNGMNLLDMLKALLGAITAVFLGVSGPQIPHPQDAVQLASSTDAVVQEVVKTTKETTPSDVAQAYELGKAVGRLEQKATQITNQASIPMQESTSTSASKTTSTPAAPTASSPAPETTTAPAPASQARIEIVNPIPGKGLGREYKAAPEIVDESNYIELGAVLYNDAGEPVADQEVRVAVQGPKGNDDAMWAKRMVGTGNVMNTWKDGQRIQVPVYPYHYEFNVAGEHKITFTSASGLTAEVTLNAQ